jgi:hypothetical protein
MVSKMSDKGMTDKQIATRLSKDKLRWQCTSEYVRALRFLYQKRHLKELPESISSPDNYITEDAIMRLLKQLDTTSLEHSIIYDRWLGDGTPEQIMKLHKISRRYFFKVQGELKARLYALLQDYQ